MLFEFFIVYIEITADLTYFFVTVQNLGCLQKAVKTGKKFFYDFKVEL